jgi:hypothetical protein
VQAHTHTVQPAHLAIGSVFNEIFFLFFFMLRRPPARRRCARRYPDGGYGYSYTANGATRLHVPYTYVAFAVAVLALHRWGVIALAVVSSA